MSLRSFTAYVCTLTVAAMGLVSVNAEGASHQLRDVCPSHVVTAGGRITAAVDAEGRVWSWGTWGLGRAGNGAVVGESAVPVQASGLTDVVSIGADAEHTVAATADGNVWAWGSHRQVILGTTIDWMQLYSGIAVPIPELSDIVQVAAGGGASFARSRSGVIYAWGINESDMLGTGNPDPTPMPTLVQGPTDVVDVVAGEYHAVALTATGTVWAWGDNSTGQLGTRSLAPQSMPIRVTGIPPMKAVAAGNGYTLAVDTAGRVWMWGHNAHELAIGTPIAEGSLEPARVPGLSGVATVAASTFSLAVTNSGDVWAWGLNNHGQLGLSTISATPFPTRVPIPEPVVTAAVSDAHAVALTTSGTLYTWGDNEFGQLGDESAAANTTPTPVEGVRDAISIGAGDSNTVAATRDDGVWAWGDNSQGQLGDGTAVSSDSPVQVAALNDVDVRTVDAGDTHMLALTASGNVYAWGDNRRGQLGLGNTADQNAPVKVDHLPSGIVKIAAAFDNSAAITESGELWVWGANTSGQLGLGTSGPSLSTSPVAVTNLPTVKAVAIGRHYMAALSDEGDVWVWGSNASNQLGIGSGTTQALSPIKLNLGGDVDSIAAGEMHMIAVMTFGDVWGWGTWGSWWWPGAPASSPLPV
ncbi:MAG: hypothetical protein LBK59_06535, partial [Bifidobacteriaceae bacterium]|nr:hypothetical protein [Bifidobacteriaceae bacterium]